MTTKSPWGVGAWAAEAERAEEEEKEAEAAAAAANASRAAATPPASFPSLKDSVGTKQKKKTKMSMQEFLMGSGGGSGASNRVGLTHDEMMRLPTRPMERGSEEMERGGRLGGGFSNYGGNYSGRNRDYGDNEGGGARRGGGGGGGGGYSSPRGSDFDQMGSRADEVDNWATMKRAIRPEMGMGGSGGPGRVNRYADLGGGGGGGGGGFSKADEVDNWGSMKKVQVGVGMGMGQNPGRGSFGTGFRNEMRPAGGDSDRWTRNLGGEKEQLASPIITKVNKPNPFGAARPREEVLTEKGVDWKKLDEDIEVKKVGGISRPNSSQSSRPGSSQSVKSDGAVLLQNQPQEGAVDVPAVKPKPKVNPFGDAKPREVLLAEKGLDWRKIDLELEHKRIDRPETDEEKNLKEEIENLKKDSLEKSGEEQSNLNDEIIKKEKDLELLILELDNKVCFAPKNIDRPGSGSGRYTGPQARVSSQPGPAEDPRGAAEFMDRPRSRGIIDSRPRQNDDRRQFSGGRDRGGFLGNREQDRSLPRNRW